MKIARDAFNKEHRLANRLIARKSTEIAFVQGVVNGVSEAQSILLEKDESAGTMSSTSNTLKTNMTDSTAPPVSNDLQQTPLQSNVQSEPTTDAANAESPGELRIIPSNNNEPTSQLAGKTHNDLTWHERDCVLHLHFHPKICGKCENAVIRKKFVAATRGVSHKSVTEWLSQENKRSETFIKNGFLC